MQFGTSQRRTMWRDFALGLAFDLIFAQIIALMWGSGQLVETGISFIALQAIYFLVWSRRTAGMWVWWFWLGGRRRQRELIADFLRERRFPKPEPFYQSATDYLDQTAADESLKPSVRIAAAAELGTLNALIAVGLAQKSMQLNFDYEDAIKTYRRSFPVASVDDQNE